MGANALLESVRRHVADLGFELVEFRKSGPPPRPVIQVRIDRPDSRPGHGVTSGDCARVTRALEHLFETSAGLPSHYTLEVSSPGIERPVRFAEHWQRYVGRTVVLKARGRSGKPRAIIIEVPDPQHVRLRLPDSSEPVLSLDEITEALLQEDSAAQGRRDP